MQTVLDFIQANWQYISAGVLLVIEVLILILKKRPQVIDTSLLASLSQFILEAESRFKVGTEKMQYVLQCANALLGDKFVEKDIRDLVEYLLTLPQKKGAK